jgi:hypothetical protein
VAAGRSKEVFKQVKSLVEEKASRTLGATMSTLLRWLQHASTTFLSKCLLNKNGQGLVEVLQGVKLCQVMIKFITLSSPNVRNLVASFKHRQGDRGYVSSILALKANTDYCYIQDSYSLGQQTGEKGFLSKMSCMEMVVAMI